MGKDIKNIKVSRPKSNRNIVVNQLGLTVKDLKAICKEKGIKGYSTMKKTQLLKAIAKHKK
jgi:ABC-type uncharacterized transport system fused permease/ATPase subunit